jgi:hypothetical protein
VNQVTCLGSISIWPIVTIFVGCSIERQAPELEFAAQELSFVGSSPEGDRVAVLVSTRVSHGPQSVRLVVLEHNEAKPLYEEIHFSRHRDPHQAISDNRKDLLAKYGIDANRPPHLAKGNWPDSTASTGIITGFIEDPDQNVAPFTIDPRPAKVCDGMNWSVRMHQRVQPALELHESCIHDVALDTVFATKKSLWFVTREQVFDGEYVGIAGISQPAF